MSQIRLSIQLKFECNTEQHVLDELDDKEREKRKGGKKRRDRKRRSGRRRIKTLGTFKANLPPSIANSTFPLLIFFSQSSSQQHDDPSFFSTLELRNLSFYLRRTKTLTSWLDAAAPVAFMTLFSSCHQLLDYFY